MFHYYGELDDGVRLTESLIDGWVYTRLQTIPVPGLRPWGCSGPAVPGRPR